MDLNKIFDKFIIPAEAQDESTKADYSLCKTCAKKRRTCCEHLGCQISPYDLKDVSVEGIIAFIDETDCISIDWWEGNPKTGENDNGRVYFLRMRGIHRDVIDPAIYGSPCMALTDNGCCLDFPHRPKGARELIPQADHRECIDNYSKEECCIEWMDFQDIMVQVVEHYKQIMFKNLSEMPDRRKEEGDGRMGIGIEGIMAHAAVMALGSVLNDIMNEEPGEERQKDLASFDSFLDDMMRALSEDEERNEEKN